MTKWFINNLNINRIIRTFHLLICDENDIRFLEI
jgi:hypothetical protein